MKEFAVQLQDEIKKANHILLHCHVSPDPDSVGSALAMKIALEQLGKKVTLIKGFSDIPKAFAFPCVEEIVQKSFSEIDLHYFDLCILLDSGGMEMVLGNDKVVFPDSLMTINIDHHVSNKRFGKIDYIEPKYSSTAELLYDLFKELDIKITHDIALNLFMGMYTDTGGFRYGEGVKTLKTAYELAVVAPDYRKTIHVMENSNRKEALIFESLALSSLKTFYNEKLAIVAVSYADLIKNGIEEQDVFTGYISNKIKSVIGIDISATLIEEDLGMVKVSFRTRDIEKCDVSKIAKALGGGGHKAAAGVRLHMPLSDAIEKVVKEVKEIYNL